MVQINGAYKFVVYDLDSRQSAIARLAAEMKTLPKYLYFPEGIPTIKQFHEENQNIRVEDLFRVISSDTAGYNFVPIFEQLKDKIGQQNLDLYTDVFLPFVSFNKSIEDVSADIQGIYILLMQTELDKANILTEKQNIERIWNDRKKILDSITKAIKINISNVNKQKKLYEQFDSISVGLPYTSFELERVNFEFTLDMINVTIMELFNYIQLNSSVPFACINNIFKILKDFMPSEEWKMYLENAIIFKVLQKTDLSGVKITDFTDAIVSILGKPGEEVITVGMSLITSAQHLTKDKLIERFLGTIKGLGDIRINNIRDSHLNGVFYFPKHCINKYVLGDLIMINPLFSSMMSIDESEKASKKKESIYIHFKHSRIGNVTANITEKVSEKGDPTLRGKDVKNDFKFGTNYIRVKISTIENLKSVKSFQELFSKLLIIYDKEYQKIVDFYRLYIPNFANVSKPTLLPVENLKLKDIAPEVFVKGYPPKCPQQPTIISDDKIEEAQGKMVMRYPQSENEGFIPRNYICEHPDAKYPGLRNNPLSNRDIVPYLPCCYTKNHKETKGTIFRHYYYGEELRTKTNVEQQDIIITNKFVPKDNYGTLPDDITKLFDIFDPQEGYMYVRKGVFDTKSSFLDCVMEGMYEETDILSFQDKMEREARLYDMREELAVPSYAASCRQEMYDFSTEEILTAIRDPNVYMDPKLFISMLEERFNCNIYVFNRTNIRNGQLALPRHLQAFYKTKRRAKCIFIYEHWGSISDHAKYPRCELIVRWRIGGGKEEDVTYYSNYDSKIAEGVRTVFNRMRKAYALNIEITETEFPINNPNLKLICQGIDSYGKCRMVKFKYKGQIGTLLTTPIQPLNLSEEKKWIVTKMKKVTALQFATSIGMVVTAQSIIQNMIKELHGILGNVNISLPIEDSVPMTGVPILEKGVSYPENEISVIDNYNLYKKLARYVVEYTYWLFSKYLQEDSSRDMNINTINSFVQNKIKVVKDFNYEHVGKIFSMNSGVMNDGKLVVKSEETLKRLVYVLRLALYRFRKKITEYHKRTVIENYYVDVTDFDQYQFQVILQGDQSVEKWIHEQKIKYNIYDSVQISFQNTPYFFKNTLIDDQIYLLQNTDDLQKALNIATVWLHSGYNPRENVPFVSELVQFTLYSYVNSKNIKKFSVGGLPTPLDIRMLGYKIEDKSFFGVLLPLK